MLHDQIADKHWSALFKRFSDYQFGIIDTHTHRIVAMANSVPLHWNGDLYNLPERGWDWAFEQAVHDHKQGLLPYVQCDIQIAIHSEYQRRDLSSQMVQTMRFIGELKGFHQLIAPIKPTQKSQYPLIDMDQYITWATGESLPFDSWLRVHTRVGGKIIKVCHQSMIIRSILAEWESWTGLKFPESVQYINPGALNPISINLEKDEGYYFEPNVWIVHNLS